MDIHGQGMDPKLVYASSFANPWTPMDHMDINGSTLDIYTFSIHGYQQEISHIYARAWLSKVFHIRKTLDYSMLWTWLTK